MSFEDTFLSKALTRLGVPYIWAGKGDWAVREGGRVVTMASLGCDFGVDCSGFITCTLRDIGGPDLRGSWGSERMERELPLPQLDEDLCLWLWPQHVALGLGRDTPFCLEAAGGDQTTLTAELARARGGRVMLGRATHGPPKAKRSLRALFAAHP